jgi:monoterpene epsilon-lactone hydrolase
MASKEHDALIGAIPDGLVDANDPVAVVREKMHALHPTTAGPGTLVENVRYAGIEARCIFVPEHSDSHRLVLHVHGGAFVSTHVDHYLSYGEHLSRHLAAKVVCFQWTWADEAPYPQAVFDTVAVYRALLNEGIKAENIMFAGDSCGGGIALAALCALRDARDPLPAGLVGLTAWLDAEQTGDAALNPRGRDPFVTAEWVRARFRDYAGPQGELSDPGISPFHAELRGLPPMYLAVGSIDATSDDSTRMALRAGREGVSVIVDVAADMVHGYIGLCGAFPEATEAMARIGLWVRQRIP